MDHTQLVARVLRDAASARASIAASYQRLWRPANSEPADRLSPGQATKPRASLRRPARNKRDRRRLARAPVAMRKGRPGLLLRRLHQAPSPLYDWHLGWLLGRWFVRLTHVGRLSGRTYRTMLEVVRENQAEKALIVVAGLGRQAHWYRNLQAHEALEVAIAGERFAPIHRELSVPEAETALADDERRNRYLAPLIHRVLSWLVGWQYDGTRVARERLVSELPLVGLRPAPNIKRRERIA
jgi:deazaflavin-dependent oxidoreductase (nitroreductase family)